LKVTQPLQMTLFPGLHHPGSEIAWPYYNPMHRIFRIKWKTETYLNSPISIRLSSMSILLPPIDVQHRGEENHINISAMRPLCSLLVALLSLFPHCSWPLCSGSVLQICEVQRWGTATLHEKCCCRRLNCCQKGLSPPTLYFLIIPSSAMSPVSHSLTHSLFQQFSKSAFMSVLICWYYCF